jgi:glucose-6-phosphate 1-dehydrogenase
VPFLIRAGKSLPVTATEVIVKLKRPPLSKLAAVNNYLRLRLGPDLSINLGARIKRPGAEMVSMPVELTAYDKPEGGELEAYERLLSDAMRGDKMLFVREDAVEAAWAIVDPILGDATPLHEYEPGTWGPTEADQLAADVEGWRNPQ